MTILNVCVRSDKALIGVDTVAVSALGPRPDKSAIERHEVSKLFPLVHLNAVLSGRGAFVYMAMLAGQCAGPLGDFDALLDAMSELVDDIHRRFVAMAPHLNVDRRVLEAGSEVVIVGWSPKEGRMLGRSWLRETGASAFSCSDISPYYTAPWHGSIALQRDPDSKEAMCAYARAQLNLIRSEFPGSIESGGRFIIAELTPGGMSIAPACDLELDLPAHAQRAFVVRASTFT